MVQSESMSQRKTAPGMLPTSPRNRASLSVSARSLFLRAVMSIRNPCASAGCPSPSWMMRVWSSTQMTRPFLARSRY